MLSGNFTLHDVEHGSTGFSVMKKLRFYRLARILLWLAGLCNYWNGPFAPEMEGIMPDEANNLPGNETPSRRDLVKKSAQVAVTAPAVALLLNASTRQAFAQISPYMASLKHILDDFTFGNTHEDIDAIALGSNFNPDDGAPQQDDHVGG
jgi:hypothetical protein